MSKPHSITVTITSTSDGEVNQRVILEEFAGSAEGLVRKNFAIADAVVLACQNVTRELAAPYLKGK